MNVSLDSNYYVLTGSCSSVSYGCCLVVWEVVNVFIIGVARFCKCQFYWFSIIFLDAN